MFDLADIFFIGVVIAVASVPLFFGLVPRNPIYGFRVPATMQDDDVWYVMNRRVAVQMIVLGVVVAAVAGLWSVLAAETTAVRAILSALTIAGMATITIRHWIAANRLRANKRSQRTA